MPTKIKIKWSPFFFVFQPLAFAFVRITNFCLYRAIISQKFNQLKNEIKYESKRVVEYKNYSLPKPIVIQRAKTKAKKLRKVGEEDDRFQFEYKISLGKLNIFIEKTCKCIHCNFCNCKFYHEKGICSHIVAAALLINKSMPGVPRQFQQKKERSKKADNFSSRYVTQICDIFIFMYFIDFMYSINI